MTRTELARFCGTFDKAYHLPWREGDEVFATDGFLLVAIPATPGDELLGMAP